MPPPDHPLELVRCADADLSPVVLRQVTGLLQDLVVGGAALGWVDPPSEEEVTALLRGVVADAALGDASLVLARSGGEIAGLGYWRRHSRPTHRPHADLERLAVSGRHQGRGVGRLVAAELLATAAEAGVEVLTLDLRGDNVRAEHLYETLGFVRYGSLARFVAVGDARYDKVLMARDLRSHPLRT